jgi:hypothetical protein
MKGKIRSGCCPIDFSETFQEGVAYDVEISTVNLINNEGKLELPAEDVEIILPSRKRFSQRIIRKARIDNPAQLVILFN